MGLDHSLAADQLVQPPGFHCVHLGRHQSYFPNFGLQLNESWEKSSKRDGIGWAMNHNDNNNISSTDGGGMYGLENSVLHAEAKACLQALRWCISKGKDEVLILTDSVNLINSLSKSKAEDIVHY